MEKLNLYFLILMGVTSVCATEIITCSVARNADTGMKYSPQVITLVKSNQWVFTFDGRIERAAKVKDTTKGPVVTFAEVIGEDTYVNTVTFNSARCSSVGSASAELMRKRTEPSVERDFSGKNLFECECQVF